MKAWRLIVMMYVLVVSGKLEVLAQSPCPVEVITTNTTASINNQKPTKKNYDPSRLHPMIFDWTRNILPLYSNAPSLSNVIQIQSPYYRTDMDDPLNLSETRDFRANDGWELIKQDLGYAYQPFGSDIDGEKNATKVGNPYFILYNKYSGNMRVLVCIGNLYTNYNAVKFELYFEKDIDDAKPTSLINTISILKPLCSLEDYDYGNTLPSYLSMRSYSADVGSWFYTDFPMTYDPCTCLVKSKLNISVWLVQTSTIEMQGIEHGTIATIQNGQGQVQPSALTKTFGVTDISNIAGKAVSSYNSIADFTNKEKKIIDSANLDPTKKKSLDFLGNLINGLGITSLLPVAPFLAAALTVADFFIGGGGTQQQSTGPLSLAPMSINATTNYTGSINTITNYKTITFWTPGSNDAANRTPEDNYPLYNQVLGTFNLLVNPKLAIQVTTACIQFCGDIDPPSTYKVYKDRVSYSLAEDIQYVVNPAVFQCQNQGDVEILAALVFEFDTDPFNNQSEVWNANTNLLEHEYFNRDYEQKDSGK